MSKKETNQDIRKGLADQIFSYFDQNIDRWTKGYTPAINGRPINMLTGEPYHGINAFLGGILSPYTSNEWVTFSQLKTIAETMKKNGTPSDELPYIRKGEKGTSFVFYKPVTFTRDVIDEHGETVEKEGQYALISRFVVFNACQIENCPPTRQQTEAKEFDPIEQAQNLLKNYQEKTNLAIYHDQKDRNFYSPSKDEIHMVPPSYFHNPLSYYTTALHEAVHSTAHATRMNRTETAHNRFGDKAYAMEEGVAELGTIYLASSMGLTLTEEHFMNHAAYIKSWLHQFKDESTILLKIVADAAKCTDYILDVALEKDKTKNHLTEIQSSHNVQLNDGIGKPDNNSEMNFVNNVKDDKKLRDHIVTKNFGPSM